MSALGVVIPVDAPIGLIALGILLVIALAGGVQLLRVRQAGVEAKEAVAQAAEAAAPVAPLEPEGRLRIQGDLHVRGHSVLPGAVEICGSLLLDADAVLDADVEVQGDASFGERARGNHPLLVHGNLTLGRDCQLPSCVVDGDVVLAPGARVLGSIRCGALYLDEEDVSPRRSQRGEEALPYVAFEKAEAP